MVSRSFLSCRQLDRQTIKLDLRLDDNYFKVFFNIIYIVIVYNVILRAALRFVKGVFFATLHWNVAIFPFSTHKWSV